MVIKRTMSLCDFPSASPGINKSRSGSPSGSRSRYPIGQISRDSFSRGEFRRAAASSGVAPSNSSRDPHEFLDREPATLSAYSGAALAKEIRKYLSQHHDHHRHDQDAETLRDSHSRLDMLLLRPRGDGGAPETPVAALVEGDPLRGVQNQPSSSSFSGPLEDKVTSYLATHADEHLVTGHHHVQERLALAPGGGKAKKKFFSGFGGGGGGK